MNKQSDSSPIQKRDYTAHADRCNRTRPANDYYVTSSQRKELIQTTGFGGYTLYTYYVENYHKKGFEYTDIQAARALGVSKRCIQDLRLKLVKTGWFLQKNGRDYDGVPKTSTYIGKKSVYKRNRKK